MQSQFVISNNFKEISCKYTHRNYIAFTDKTKVHCKYKINWEPIYLVMPFISKHNIELIPNSSIVAPTRYKN